jgi:hypothetical protein
MFIPTEVTAWAGLTVYGVFCLCLLVSSFVCLNNLNGREDSSNIIRYQGTFKTSGKPCGDRKSIIALTYVLSIYIVHSRHFTRWQKINNRSLWSSSKDTRIYVFPIIRTYLLMLEHSRTMCSMLEAKKILFFLGTWWSIN